MISDILTFEEHKGDISGKKLAWIGDGNNNMSNSFIEASVKFNFILNIGCPKNTAPIKKLFLGPKTNAQINIMNDAKEAARGADCVMTDKWISMNDK